MKFSSALLAILMVLLPANSVDVPAGVPSGLFEVCPTGTVWIPSQKKCSDASGSVQGSTVSISGSSSQAPNEAGPTSTSGRSGKDSTNNGFLYQVNSEEGALTLDNVVPKVEEPPTVNPTPPSVNPAGPATSDVTSPHPMVASPVTPNPTTNNAPLTPLPVATPSAGVLPAQPILPISSEPDFDQTSQEPDQPDQVRQEVLSQVLGNLRSIGILPYVTSDGLGLGFLNSPPGTFDSSQTISFTYPFYNPYWTGGS